MSRQSHWPRILLLTLLLAVGAITLTRGLGMRYDFHHFYLDARYVWEHGELNPLLTGEDGGTIRQLPFYLPFVPLLLAPLTAGGPGPAACIWAAMQVVALAYAIRVLYRWCGSSGTRAEAILIIAVVAALPAVFEAARFNQLSFLLLALVVGGVDGMARGRGRMAGVLLGCAAVVKLLPGVFLLWMLLKRRWTACASFVVSAGVVAVLPCLAVFGPQRTLEYHQEWWQHNVRGAAAKGMTDPGLRAHFIDHRNQSIPAVLSRLMWSEHPHRVPWQPVRVSRPATRILAIVIATVFLALLVITTRRSAAVLSTPDLHAEGASYATAMLVLSPLMRQYYLVWALPALVLLAAATADRDSPEHRRRGVIGLVVWVLGMGVWLMPTARLYGVHLVMLIALAVLLTRVQRKGGVGDSHSTAVRTSGTKA